MSPDMPATIDRTAACAPDSEHGAPLEQVLPLPEGDAYRVVVAAAAGTADAATMVPATTPVTTAFRRAWERGDMMTPRT